MAKPSIYNVPNALSAYRLVALPFIIASIFYGNKNLFITLITVNLITDFLDGFIARTFHLETELGAKLDSLADMGTYISAVAGMLVLEKEFVNNHTNALALLISLYLLPYVISLFRFRQLNSFHLYSSKVVAYIQGIFIITYFIWGYLDWYFYFMIIASCASYIEEILIVVLINKLRSNLKSVYHFMKNPNGG
jgi:cardiolipin synthase